MAEGRRLIEVTTADMTAAIPSCPDWQAADLLGHIANGWEAFRVILETPSVEPPDFAAFSSAPDDHSELGAFAIDRLEAAAAAVASIEPDQPVWTYLGVKPCAFWARRSHFETLVHRVDAELGAESPTPIDGAVGFDGVDELYAVLVAERAQDHPSGSLHLHQTDGDGELMLQVVDGAISVTHEHAKGDAAVRASGEDLLLVSWGRRSLEGLELFGDESVAQQWFDLSP